MFAEEGTSTGCCGRIVTGTAIGERAASLPLERGDPQRATLTF
jgi:hypothetical protein